MAEVPKSDWKLFMAKVPEWQERYMDKLLKQYIRLLKDESKDPSERFWKLDERMKKDKKNPGVQMELEKKEVPYDIVRLIRLKIIKPEDIEDFSDSLKDYVDELMERSYGQIM